MTTTVAVSGGFDPAHIGHIRLMQEASKLADKLIVILNNDNWLKTKKGFAFMPQEERKEILEAYDFVSRVVITAHAENDSDTSVCRELREIHPTIFANGGDRKEDNIPEYALCEELGISMVFNVGGEKYKAAQIL